MQARAGSLAVLAIALAAMIWTGCTTDATRRAYLRTLAESYGPPPRPAIIIPGFGVTRLYDPVIRRFVWGTGHATVRTRWPDDLDLPIGADGTVGHDRLVPRGYTGSRGEVDTGWQLIAGLRKYGRYTPGVDVFPFEYDWRLGAMENAARLASLVDRIRRDHGAAKVDLVTHSAGALVALAYVKLLGGGAEVDHLVMISAPRRGVVDALRVFVRPERFIRRTFRPDMVATWPFVPELLPDDGRFLVDERGSPVDADLWSAAAWKRFLHLAPPAEEAFARNLAAARTFRRRLRSASMPDQVHISVIAGDCVPTAHRVLLRSDGSFVFYPHELRTGERRLGGLLFQPGDGTVPIDSASAGGPAFVVCDGHQGITTDPSVHRAIISTLREQPPL